MPTPIKYAFGGGGHRPSLVARDLGISSCGVSASKPELTRADVVVSLPVDKDLILSLTLTTNSFHYPLLLQRIYMANPRHDRHQIPG